MRILYLAASALFSVSVFGQGVNVNFRTGKFPENVSVQDRDGASVPGMCYKNGRTAEGWTISSVGTTGYAAVSPSHNHDGIRQDNLLIIDAAVVPDNAVLRWAVRSCNPDFPDTYRIIAVEEGTDEEIGLFEGIAPDAFENMALKLDGFAGKSVRFGVVCTSENGYMLALKELIVESPSAPLFSIRDTSCRFQGGAGDARLTGEIYNYGAPSFISSVILESEADEVVIDINRTVDTGESVDYATFFPAQKDVQFTYSVAVLDESGNETARTSPEAVIVSDFARVHFVDEATGMWCNNCPDGAVSISKYMARYPGEVVLAADHANDEFMVEDYWAGLKFYAAPYFMMNRDSSTKNSSTGYFDRIAYGPTRIGLLLKRQAASVVATVSTSEDLDNSSDRYRLGYVITGDLYCSSMDASYNSKYYQSNGCTMASREQYYFLPTRIPAHLAKMHSINLGGEGCFTGIPNSIAASLTDGKSSDYIFFEPEYMDGEFWSNPQLLAFVIDTEDGTLMNAASISLDPNYKEPESSVCELEKADFSPVISGHLMLVGYPVSISIYSLSGTLMWKAEANGTVTLPEYGSSPVIVRVTGPTSAKCLKVVL